MAKLKWKSFLNYQAIEFGAKDKQLTVKTLSSYAPVTYFSVKGGAERLIDLTSTDDISVASEFEQARSLENLRLFLPPVKGFAGGDLIEIALNKLTFSTIFYIESSIGKTTKETLTLHCEATKIIETPQRKAVGNEYLLGVWLSIPNSTILRGSHNPSGSGPSFEKM